MKRSIITQILLISLFSTFPFKTFSQVIFKSEHGFTIQIEQQANVDSKTAYQQFLKINEWWNAEHTYFGKSENLFIEPKANGCFCEVEGDKQVLHMIVSYVEPNKEIRMIGGLGPLQMMGINGGMSWKFIDLGNNKSKIIHRYQVSGTIDGGLDKIAPFVDQVQIIQVTALINKLSLKK